MSDPHGETPHVWDGPTRWFHWINLVLVFLLALSGYFVKYRSVFQVSGSEAKMAIIAAHAWVGYAFAINLAVRLIWAFVGNRNARWRAILPDRQALRGMGAELRALWTRRPVAHLVRSPVSRLSATLMFIVMLGMAGTGLARAGTDLYPLPLGPAVAAFVAKAGNQPSAITWRNELELGDEERLRLVGRVKTLTGVPHLYGSWILMGLIALHIAGVTLTEVRQRSGLISTMVSGTTPPAAQAPPHTEPDPTRIA